MNVSQITSEINLQAAGKHQGFLRLSHSVHRSAYGWIPIPIVSIRNGDGPVVLLMAGNHGDEYEGQIALCKLIKNIPCNHVNGQIIVLPMANFPAAKAGMRTSPIDQGNLNRSFPGDPNGTPTQIIAHYIETELLSRSDYSLDIHSGGSSLVYIPSLLMGINTDTDKHRRNLDLLKSLRFPQALLFDSPRMGPYSSSAAIRQGCTHITAEVAGGGTVNHRALNRLYQGLFHYLSHIEVLDLPDAQRRLTRSTGPCHDMEILHVTAHDSYCYALHEGLFEPMVDLGDEIEKGQLAALIHDPGTPWSSPAEVFFQTTGKVICKRVPAQVRRGDCLFEIGLTAIPSSSA